MRCVTMYDHTWHGSLPRVVGTGTCEACALSFACIYSGRGWTEY